MDYKLVTSSRAEKDIERIVEYYMDINPLLAKSFLEELKATRTYIHRNPKKIQIRYGDIRVAFLNRFPVGVHFRLSHNYVQILAIFGTSEDSKKWIE